MNNRPESLIAAAVIGYYRIPPIWVGEEPVKEDYLIGNENPLTRTEFSCSLSCGIRVQVRRDGLFLFDFSAWPPAERTEVPGWNPVPGSRVPKEVTEAEQLAETRLALRAQVINAHQACLSTAETVEIRRSSDLGVPVQQYETFRPFIFDMAHVGGPHHDGPTSDYVRDQIRFVENRQKSKIGYRTLFNIQTLDRSFRELDKILNSDVPNLLELVEILFRSATDYRDQRFAESIILSWSVCESLLGEMWAGLVSEKEYLPEASMGESAQGNSQMKRVNKDRRSKLMGTQFSASIITEVLELNDRIPFSLFQKIESLRKIRNDRLHSLKSVAGDDASMAVRTAEELMECVTNFRPYLTLSRNAGDGLIPKSLLDQYVRQHEPSK